jgi:predicted component of type VI protein secretion system
MRTLMGGVAPEEVRKQIAESRKVLERDSAYLKKLRGILEDRSKVLEKAVSEIISG